MSSKDSFSIVEGHKNFGPDHALGDIVGQAWGSGKKFTE